MIYLYKFAFYSKPLGGDLISLWTHTSYQISVTNDAYPAVTFTPQPGITHSEVRYDGEKSAGQITVTVPRDYPVALLFLGGYPEGSIELEVIELDDANPATVPSVAWRGYIRSSNLSELTAELLGTDGREMAERLGLRLNGCAGCQWNLYGPECGLNEVYYTSTGTVTAISPDGLTVSTTLTEPSANHYKAGNARANGQTRMVVANTGGELTLMSAMSGLTVGDTITAAKGCSRDPDSCKSFGNIVNFSGFAEFETPRNIYSEGVK